MTTIELNDAGKALVARYREHLLGGCVCRCDTCRAVRRMRLDEKPIVRPMCCGQEMAWQGDPVIANIGYACLKCGREAASLTSAEG